jgi:hypothetical protein
MGRRGPGWRGLLPVALVLLAGSACKLELDVNVDVARDGSGFIEVVVGLDPDALGKIGGDLAAVMDVRDLQDAGWVIDGPTEESDGFTRVRVRHPFGSPGEAAEVMAQIAGADGPFQDFRVTRHESFAETTWRLTGKVDFGRGLQGLGDEGRAPQLDGEPLGQSVEEIEAQLGDSLSRLIQIRVNARLPGEVTSNAITKADNGAVWQVGFGEGTVDLDATGHERHTATLVLAGAGVVTALALLILLLVRLAGRVTAKDRRAL